MKSLLISFAALSILASSGFAQCDRPVASVEVSSDGTFRAGFMYWYAPSGLFLYPSEFVLLGVVSDLTPPRDTTDASGGGFWIGKLDVTSVVLCRADLRAPTARIRSLVCTGFDGLAVGDTVLVFMVPYEGSYVVPRREGTNTLLGHRLPRNPTVELFDPRRFVDLLSQGSAWDLGALNFDQLRLWAWVDPRGVAEALIREREESRGNSR